MSFIEKLRQQQAAEALRAQQIKDQQEATVKERQQRETAERERHAQRKKQAERFQGESGVSLAVKELGKFLATPTIPVVRQNFSVDYVVRGSSYGYVSSVESLPIPRNDPDSVFDIIEWDRKDHGSSKDKKWGYNTHHSKKLIAVEFCPNGTIVFHAGWASTNVPLERWRAKDREQIFDQALERAYRNPINHRYKIWHEPSSHGGGH